MSFLSPTIYRVCRGLLRYTWARLHPVEVQGLEHLPAAGPAIICPKHQRWEDILAVALALPPPLYYIAKAELFVTPLQREFLRALGGVPVDRRNPRATLSSFRQLLPLLQEKAYIVLFPEGTYFRGRMGPGKHRLVQMLLKLQERHGLGPLPFVPVGLSYETSRRPSGWSVAVRLGPPLSAPGAGQAAALTQALLEQIARLCRGPEMLVGAWREPALNSMIRWSSGSG
uniref:1-acyl-sn-glycerol-3-phosphate acyltransferase n=1 Tax=Desulfobacca acetoxidans TaxID=60893 RepID=A0A7C3V814_9BACT